MKKGNVAAFLA